MDFSAIAKDAFAVILPSLMTIRDGGLKSIGSDLWELIKKSFKSNERDKKIVTKLEENPNDLQLQAIATYKLIEFLEKDPDLAKKLIKCIKAFREKEQISNQCIQGNNTYNNSPVYYGSGTQNVNYNVKDATDQPKKS